MIIKLSPFSTEVTSSVSLIATPSTAAVTEFPGGCGVSVRWSCRGRFDDKKDHPILKHTHNFCYVGMFH
jgi:hypothetical protein